MKTDTNKPATTNSTTNLKDDGTHRTGSAPQVLAGRPGVDPTLRPEVTTGPRDEGTRIFPTASESEGQGRDKSNELMRCLDAMQDNVSKLRKALRASASAVADEATERKGSERNASAEAIEVRETVGGTKTV
jgi:hypothetical protein